VDHSNHDTVGMVVGNNGVFACGTSTNGASHKVAGRVGDSPIVGSGCYVSNDVGGAAATGDGDIMMRFMPSFSAWSYMRQGYVPKEACELALSVIPIYFPTFQGGIVCLNKDGEHGAAAYNMDFSYSVASDDTDGTISIPVPASRLDKKAMN
jgi:N4-(beta-N-acetylglucosaminyl)-L-asparaginase